MSDAALFAALAQAQREFPDIPKSKTVNMTLKSGRALSYSYAPFEAVVSAVREPLATFGLSFSHMLSHGNDGKPFLQTLLMHKDGGRLEASFPLPVHDGMSAQEIGSAITYMRRYALVSMLGLATDEDDDGATATDAVAAAPKPTPAPKPAEPKPTSQFQAPAGAATRTRPDLPVPVDGKPNRYAVTSHITYVTLNDKGWYEMGCVIDGTEEKLATKLKKLAEQAGALVDTTARVEFTEKVNGKYVNRYLEHVEPVSMDAAYEAIGMAAAAAGPGDPNIDIPFGWLA